MKCAVFSIPSFGHGREKVMLLENKKTSSLKFAIGLQTGWHHPTGRTLGKQLTRLLPAPTSNHYSCTFLFY